MLRHIKVLHGFCSSHPFAHFIPSLLPRSPSLPIPTLNPRSLSNPHPIRLLPKNAILRSLYTCKSYPRCTKFNIQLFKTTDTVLHYHKRLC